MARIRTVKPGYFTNEDLAAASIAARLLGVSLLNQADCAGRLADRPRRIKLDAMPWDEVDVDALLGELAHAGYLVRYEVAGQRLIQILNFGKHQRLSGSEARAASEYPAPPNWEPPTPDGDDSGSTEEAPAKQNGTLEREEEKEGKGNGMGAEGIASTAAAFPKGASHPYSADQLERLKKALPVGQFISPEDMPEKIRIDLGRLIEKNTLQHTVLGRWKNLEPAQKVEWIEEALRRAVEADRPAAWRFHYAAEQIGRALENGLDLFADGWRRPGSQPAAVTPLRPGSPRGQRRTSSMDIVKQAMAEEVRKAGGAP